jgi:hypothetical protein
MIQPSSQDFHRRRGAFGLHIPGNDHGLMIQGLVVGHGGNEGQRHGRVGHR